MKTKILFFLFSTLICFLITPVIIAWACNGTTRVPPIECPRSTWIAITVQESVNIDPNKDIEIHLELLTGLKWGNDPRCAIPESGHVELTIICKPQLQGARVPPPKTKTVNIFNSRSGHPRGELISSAIIELATTDLDLRSNYICEVEGTFFVTFGNGFKPGTVKSEKSKSDKISLVQSLVNLPHIPRLKMSIPAPHIEGNNTGFYQSCKKGDQTFNYYLIENNDPNEKVEFDFSTWTNQVARMPEYTDNLPSAPELYAISDPRPDTDNFPQEFEFNLVGGQLIPLPPPGSVGDQKISTGSIVLASEELTFIQVAIRSDGMCAEGSCSEAIALLEGEFSENGQFSRNKKDALACVSTALVVNDNAIEKSPLCTVLDSLHTDNNESVLWSPAIFDGDNHLSTNVPGNIETPIGELKNTRTAGSNLNSDFPSNTQDTLRMEITPSTVEFEMVSESSNQFMIFFGRNFPSNETVNVPLIGKMSSPSNLRVEFDWQHNSQNPTVQIVDLDAPNQPILFNGTLTEFTTMPQTGLVVNTNTFREFSCNGIPSNDVLGTSVPWIAKLYPSNNINPGELEYTLQVYDPRNGKPLPWEAECVSDTHPDAVRLMKPTGLANEDIQLEVDPAKISVAPYTTLAYLRITSPNTLNSPLIVPIAVRRQQETSSIDSWQDYH